MVITFVEGWGVVTEVAVSLVMGSCARFIDLGNDVDLSLVIHVRICLRYQENITYFIQFFLSILYLANSCLDILVLLVWRGCWQLRVHYDYVSPKDWRCL